MIVILCQSGDTSAALLGDGLRERGAEVTLWSEPLRHPEIGLTWFSDDPARSRLEFRDSGRRVSFNEIGGLVNRLAFVTRPASAGDETFIEDEIDATLLALLAALGCPVVNRPRPGRFGGPPPVGLDRGECLRDCGLGPPDVLVTSSASAAREFLEASEHDAMIGSPSGAFPWRVVARKDVLSDLSDRVGAHPVLLARVEPGRRFEVFVAGHDVYDSRSAAAATTSGSDLAGRCRRLARRLGLDFAQLSCVQVAPDRELCLDVSERPSISQLSRPLRGRILDSLARFLAVRRERAAG